MKQHEEVVFNLHSSYTKVALWSSYTQVKVCSSSKLHLLSYGNYAGDLRETRHFFGNRAERRNLSKKQKCSRPAVRDGSGYWKLSGKEKRIAASMSNQVIGMKRNLVFCQGRSSDSVKPKWIMQELCLLSHQTTSDSTWLGNQMVSSFLS